MPRDFFGNYPIVAGLGFSRDVNVLDDCEGAMTWIISGTGGDDVHENAAVAAFQGAYGLHLKTRTTDAAEDDYLMVQKRFDMPASNLLVARLKIAPVNPDKIKYLDVNLGIDDGVQPYLGAVRFDFDAGKVYHAKSPTGWTEIPALATVFSTLTWYTLELSVDCGAHTYLNVRFNGLSADLSDQALQPNGATNGRAAYLYTNQTTWAGHPAEVYLDNIYVGEIPEA